MIGKGLKRKLSDDDLLEAAVMQKGTGLYLDQRQSVLNISLDKFQRGQMMAEPSLRRSVLIANTLRQIQDEIRQENSGMLAENCSNATTGTGTINGAHSVPPVVEPSNNREVPPQRLSLENHPLSSSEGDDWMMLSSEEDFSLSSAISSILKELDVVLDGSSAPVPPRIPLSSIENVTTETKGSPGVKLDTLVCKSDRSGNYADGYKLCDSVFGNFEVLSSSYLNDVPLDDLFLDIDTSVYERESGSLGSVLSGRTFSTTAGEELLKYLPSCSPSFTTNPSCRDLNELEHIMEILVGS
ncbi:SERTA domain-containing protein 3 [Polypterus senegalus]